MSVVEEDAGIGDAVFGGDGGIVDLWDADVEEPVSRADDERAGVADGVRESDAGGEIIGIVGTLPAGGNNGLERRPAVAKVCRSQRTPRLTASRLVTRMVSWAKAA